MNKIKVIIFDFDGIIVESVNVKTEAFAELYRPYGGIIEERVVKHHLANGGMSRFEKFKIYHKEFLKKTISENEIIYLSNKFSKLVVKKVIEAPYVKGAKEFIKMNYKKYDFFISSGTPENEIKHIAKMRGIDKYFKEIYGSPEKKGKHVKIIIKNNNYSKGQIVFIGDALSDRNAAKENGILFIGRYTTSEEIKRVKYLINDFDDLKKLLLSLNNEALIDD